MSSSSAEQTNLDQTNSSSNQISSNMNSSIKQNEETEQSRLLVSPRIMRNRNREMILQFDQEEDQDYEGLDHKRRTSSSQLIPTQNSQRRIIRQTVFKKEENIEKPPRTRSSQQEHKNIITEAQLFEERERIIRRSENPNKDAEDEEEDLSNDASHSLQTSDLGSNSQANNPPNGYKNSHRDRERIQEIGYCGDVSSHSQNEGQISQDDEIARINTQMNEQDDILNDRENRFNRVERIQENNDSSEANRECSEEFDEISRQNSQQTSNRLISQERVEIQSDHASQGRSRRRTDENLSCNQNNNFATQSNSISDEVNRLNPSAAQSRMASQNAVTEIENTSQRQQLLATPDIVNSNLINIQSRSIQNTNNSNSNNINRQNTELSWNWIRNSSGSNQIKRTNSSQKNGLNLTNQNSNFNSNSNNSYFLQNNQSYTNSAANSEFPIGFRNQSFSLLSNREFQSPPNCNDSFLVEYERENPIDFNRLQQLQQYRLPQFPILTTPQTENQRTSASNNNNASNISANSNNNNNNNISNNTNQNLRQITQSHRTSIGLRQSNSSSNRLKREVQSDGDGRRSPAQESRLSINNNALERNSSPIPIVNIFNEARTFEQQQSQLQECIQLQQQILNQHQERSSLLIQNMNSNSSSNNNLNQIQRIRRIVRLNQGNQQQAQQHQPSNSQIQQLSNQVSQANSVFPSPQQLQINISPRPPQPQQNQQLPQIPQNLIQQQVSSQQQSQSQQQATAQDQQHPQQSQNNQVQLIAQPSLPLQQLQQQQVSAFPQIEQQDVLEDIGAQFLSSDKLAVQTENIDLVKCPICMHIYYSPIACGNCLNHYCKLCIREWLKRNPGKCPLCKNYREMRCVPMLKNMLDKLSFFCCNKESGCEEILNYESVSKHEDKCEFKIEVCSIYGCGQQMIRKLISKHIEEECEFAKEKCIWCSQQVKKRIIAEHEESCDMKEITCQECQEKVRLKNKAMHEETCPDKQIRCTWCDEQYKRKEISDHEDICNDRVVKCNGCQFECCLNDHFIHAKQCLEITVLCSRCMVEMKRKDLFQHSIEQCLENASRQQYSQIFQLQSDYKQLSSQFKELQQNTNSQLQTISSQITKLLNPLIEQKFSFHYKDQDIFVNRDGSMALVRENKKKRRDRFILIDQKSQLLATNDQITFKILSRRSEWFAIGICDESNVYAARRYHDIGHQSYLISANGVLYSTHSQIDNWQNRPFQIDQDDVISIYFNVNQSSSQSENQIAGNSIANSPANFNLNQTISNSNNSSNNSSSNNNNNGNSISQNHENTSISSNIRSLSNSSLTPQRIAQVNGRHLSNIQSNISNSLGAQIRQLSRQVLQFQQQRTVLTSALNQTQMSRLRNQHCQRILNSARLTAHGNSQSSIAINNSPNNLNNNNLSSNNSNYLNGANRIPIRNQSRGNQQIRIELRFVNHSKNQELVIPLDSTQINLGKFYYCACLRCPGDSIQIVENPAQARQQNPQQQSSVPEQQIEVEDSAAVLPPRQAPLNNVSTSERDEFEEQIRPPTPPRRSRTLQQQSRRSNEDGEEEEEMELEIE